MGRVIIMPVDNRANSTVTQSLNDKGKMIFISFVMTTIR